jgi:hypothetical protein
MTNVEKGRPFGHSSFEVRHSFVIRHWWVIRHFTEGDPMPRGKDQKTISKRIDLHYWK